MTDLWNTVSTDFVPRAAVFEVWGPTSTGKTTFALSAPGPIAIISTGEKTAGIVERAAIDREIRIVDCSIPASLPGVDIRAKYRDVEKKFFEAFYDAFKWARSIIIDTHTDAWELSRLAEFGAPKPASGRPSDTYTEINARWNAAAMYAQNQTKSFVFWIGSVREEWGMVTGQNGTKSLGRTGKLVRDSFFRGLLPKSHIIIQTLEPSPSGPPMYTGRFEKAWLADKQLRGTTIPEEDFTVPRVMASITDTEPEEWEE